MWILNKIDKVLRSERKLASIVVPASSCPVLFYSRKSNTKSVELMCKPVKSKFRLDDSGDFLRGEGAPNWELLGSRGSRFIFPNLVGLAWQEPATTVQPGIPIKNLVDFGDRVNEKLQVNIFKCPTLIRRHLHELFPTHQVVSREEITIITLRHFVSKEHEQGARKFVIAAREICSRLHILGFWADFMNPFSGKPFYCNTSGKNLYKIDERFRGLCMKLEKQQSCLVISPDDENAFSGSIFTDVPSNRKLLQSLLKS